MRVHRLGVQRRSGGRTWAVKTHLATAIGVQALEHYRRRVRVFSTIDLVNAIEQEKLVGKPGQLAARRADEKRPLFAARRKLRYSGTPQKKAEACQQRFRQCVKSQSRHIAVDGRDHSAM